MKNSVSHYDDTLAAIESTTDFNDMFLQDIAAHGPNNILNNNLSESANAKLQNIAKQKIRDLENAAYKNA